MQRLPLIAVLLGATLGSVAVDAQSPAQQTPRTRDAEQQTQQTRKPPGWLFTPSFGFGASWDDNVLLSNPGDNPVEAYGIPIDSALSLDYLGRRLSFSSGYGGSLVRYRTFDEFNSSDQRVHVVLEHRTTSRLTLRAQENFIQAPTTDELDITGVPFYRTGSRANEAGGGFGFALARHTKLDGNYVLRSVTFDQRVGQNLQDGHEHEITLDLTRAVSPRLTIGGQYQLRREILSQGRDRFNIQSGGVSVAYHLAPTITLSGLFGVSSLGASQTSDAQLGPVVTVAVGHRTRDITLSAEYHRSFVPSYGFGGTFQNEEWLGSVHVPLGTSRLYTNGSVAWFDNDPLESGQPSLQSLWLSATLGYRALRWLNVEVYGDRTQQDTQRPGGDLRRNQVGFRMAVSKPVRIR